MWWTTPVEAAVLDEAAAPEAWLEEARARALVGDWTGMRIAAERAGSVDGPHVVDAVYLTGMALELGGDPSAALVQYDRALDLAPSDSTSFRRAVALWRLDRCAEVWPVLDVLDVTTAASPSAVLQLSVLRGACEVATGEVRDGIGRITDTLQNAAPTDSPPWQAEARLLLVRALAAQAEGLHFTGSDRKRRKIADVRSSLVKAARDQLAPLIRLSEPGPALAAFVRVEQANEQFCAALSAEERPRKVRTPEQIETWEQARDKLADEILTLTDVLIDRGQQLAAQTGWQGPEADALDEARTRVRAALER